MVNIHRASVLGPQWTLSFSNQPDCSQWAALLRPTNQHAQCLKISFSFSKVCLQTSISAFILKSSSVVSEVFLKQAFWFYLKKGPCLGINLTNLHSEWNITQKSSLSETSRKLVSKDMRNQDEKQQNIKGKFAHCHPLPSFQLMILI